MVYTIILDSSSIRSTSFRALVYIISIEMAKIHYILMVVGTFAFLVISSRASPLNKHSDHQEAKELHFNRTMEAKAKLLNKVESSINQTITKLADVREKITKVIGKVKAKVMEALNNEVEKWASVGDKLQKKKTAFFNNLMEKMTNAKESTAHNNLKNSIQHKTTTKSTLRPEIIPVSSTTSPARSTIE